jgi:hypothetical protein
MLLIGEFQSLDLASRDSEAVGISEKSLVLGDNVIGVRKTAAGAHHVIAARVQCDAGYKSGRCFAKSLTEVRFDAGR